MLVWQQQRLFEERWEVEINGLIWVLLRHDVTIVNSRLVTSKYFSGKVSPCMKQVV